MKSFITRESIELFAVLDEISRATGTAPKKRIPQLIRDSKKIGRNELCPCNSGLKYKKCCQKLGENSVPKGNEP